MAGLAKDAVGLRDVKVEADLLRREVAAMANMKFENAQLKKMASMTENVVITSQASIRPEDSKTPADSHSVKKAKNKTRAMSQPEIKDVVHDIELHNDLPSSRNALQNAECELITAKPEKQQ